MLSLECHNDIFEGFKRGHLDPEYGVVLRKNNFVIEALKSLQITSFCISDKYLILNCHRKRKKNTI